MVLCAAMPHHGFLTTFVVLWIVLHVVRCLLRQPKKVVAGSKPVTEADIGIIAPYVGQVQAIAKALSLQKISVSKEKNEDAGTGDSLGIEVKSVDGYQVCRLAIDCFLSWQKIDLYFYDPLRVHLQYEYILMYVPYYSFMPRFGNAKKCLWSSRVERKK